MPLSKMRHRSAFQAKPLIYVPEPAREYASWASPHECLWEAPGYMLSSYPLKSRYHDIAQGKDLGALFHDILGIPDAGVDDFLLELEWRKDSTDVEYDLVYDLYQELNARRLGMDDKTVKKIR